MKLSTVEFIKLLPQFMRDDAANIGLANGTDVVIKRLEATIGTLSTWDSIDSLTEAELDDLAWELNIEWYRKDATITAKRQVIKDSNKMHQHLGTKWAVERIINTYFGDGYIKEWFEYQGTAGHFKIFSSNPSVTNEKLQEFMSVLDKVKRASAHLDGITISLTGQMPIHIGCQYHESGFDTCRIGSYST